MDAKQISKLGGRLMGFLVEVDDCFGRSEPREHLRTFVSGQLSDLHRKSIEPIALASGTPPRTLQRFFESVRWDELRLRDRLQWIVARNVLQPDEMKFFVANLWPGSSGVSLAWLWWVATT